jgi:hypothetical protein
MQMRVSNRLAGSLANIDSDVVAVRHSARLDVLPNYRNKSPNGGLFLLSQGEEIRFVPPRNNQAVSVVQWESVWKRSRELVHSNEVSASESITEDTVQFVSPMYPRPPARAS